MKTSYLGGMFFLVFFATNKFHAHCRNYVICCRYVCSVYFCAFTITSATEFKQFVFLSRFHFKFQTIYYPNSPEDIRNLGLDTPQCSRGLWQMPQEVEVGGAEFYSFWLWPEKILF